MKKLSARISPCSPPSPAPLHPPSESVVPERNPGTEGTLGEEPRWRERSCGWMFRVVLRVALGLVMGVCMASSWAWSAHIAKETLSQFYAPFFISWFCSIWNLLFFPLYYSGHLVGHRQWEEPGAQFRRCVRLLGEARVTVRVLLRFSAPFSFLWIVSMFLLLLSLSRISVSDCSSVLCCSRSFTFLLAWIGLKDRFMGVRVVAVILSITGIVMLAYADGFHSDSITGVALVVGSASTSAIYQVLYRKRVGLLDAGVASVLLCCVGVCALLLHSWLCVLLYVTHVEFWPPSEPVPWRPLCITATLLLVYNVIVNMGGACTYPTLISLGVLLTIPASTAVDVSEFSSPALGGMRLSALGLISTSFLLLLLPEDWDDRTLHWLSSLWSSRDEKQLTP